MSIPSDMSLIGFKSIVGFVTDLESVFGEDQRSVVLYKHLLSKTTLAHNESISKHIKVFDKFCRLNCDAIEKNDKELMKEYVLEFSEKVKLDFKYMLDNSDADTLRAIWTHFLTISAILNPAGQAKKVLIENRSKNGESESDFLADIIGKIENNVDPSADPMEAIGGMMKSGVLNDLIGGLGTGLQDGSLDMGKLMGSVQNMVSGIQGGSGTENEGGGLDLQNMMIQMAPMVQNLTSSSTLGEAGGRAPPDIMSMLGPIMSQLDTNDGGKAPDLKKLMDSLPKKD